jgi:ABC-type cobalamin transport system permease subunit
MMTERGRQTDAIISWAVYGAVVAGVLAVVGSVLSFLARDLSASAGFLLAAGVAFGLLAGALLRQ